MILLHNLWTGTVTALAFYLAANIAKEIYPRIIEVDPVFRHPRISSLVVAILLVLSSGLKAFPAAPAVFLHLKLDAVLALLIIAALEIYGAYFMIQMGIRRKTEVGCIIKAFSVFLCGALIEALFITWI